MSQIAFKLLIFSLLLVTITGVLALFPDAGPLPNAIEDLILWLVPMLYFIDPIFPVSTFFQVMTFVINSFIGFFTLVGLKKIMNTAISSTS